MNEPIVEVDKAEIDSGAVTPEPESKFDGMSGRDALQKAIVEKREVPAEVAPKPEQAQPAKSVAAPSAEPEPPSEFSADGKKAWKDKDVTGIQKEFRRLHDARTKEITRAQAAERRANEDAKTWRELGKMAAPYIEARGHEGVSPDKAIMEALALIQEFKKGDPATVKAELKKIGIDLDAKGTATTSAVDPAIDSLQKTVKELKSEREAEKLQKVAQTFETIFNSLTSQKTRAGESVFPDLLDNSEKGMQFARELGSLTKDERFQAGVLRRFPDADLTVVVREAYKYLGGKVSGEPVKVSQDDKKHIEKSRRAAASTPGRAVARNESSNLVGKLSNRAALIRAIEEREH